MMRPATQTPLLLLLLLAAPAAAQPAPSAAPPAARPPAEIGSWQLACIQDRMTDQNTCQLRAKDWVEPPNGARPGLALEVIDRGGRLVPAVTARDLTLDGASRALLAVTGTAQLRFPPNRLFEMPCGLEGRSLVCAPRPEDAARAERELLVASVALARMVGGTGQSSQAEPTELRLTETRDALARYAREAPPGSSAPAAAAAPGLGLGVSPGEVMQRLQRLFGP